MPDPSGLYPQPPAPPQSGGSLLADPGKAVGLLQAIQSLQIQGAQAPALMQQPGAALAGQNIANTRAAAELHSYYTNRLHDIFGSQADSKDPDAAYHAAATAARTSDVPPAMISEYLNTARRMPGGLPEAMRRSRNISIGSAGAGANVPIINPATGEQTIVPQGAVNLSGSGLATSLPPGGGESSQARQEDLRRSGQFKDDIFPLMKARELAEKLGPGGMAPGSKGRQEFESFVYGLAPSILPESMRDKIRNYAELEKYLVNNASQRAQNLGPHTNEGLATATTGSPNVHINDLAGKELIDAQIALRRMEHAVTMQASRAAPQNYTAEKARLGSIQDPRAYRIDLMKPEEIQTLQKTLKGPERARFNSSLKAAIDSGAVSPPGR